MLVAPITIPLTSWGFAVGVSIYVAIEAGPPPPVEGVVETAHMDMVESLPP